MKQEMQLFDLTENPSPTIIKLCEALKTIPPTSVEAERAFSAAGLFLTKLRTRLSDKTIAARIECLVSDIRMEVVSSREPQEPEIQQSGLRKIIRQHMMRHFSRKQ
ncbi:hypothetical protein TNCV_4734511 [Trichonephila clavipes]|nr:hypothetical protein TNCV_4734511 [Trichonephila clavipes]